MPTTIESVQYKLRVIQSMATDRTLAKIEINAFAQQTNSGVAVG